MNNNFKQPFFSVIMNCRNSSTYLNEAILSVYKQTFLDWEIIFYDNSSTDSSPEIAKSFDEKLKYFKSEKSLPLGAARNAAISNANGTFLAFLDCDDVWLPDKLHKQKNAIQSHTSDREIAFCYTGSTRIDNKGNYLLSSPSFSGEGFQGNVFSHLLSECFISMSSAVVKRDVFNKLNGFKPYLEYVEEWDLWLRLSFEYDLAYVNSPLTKIRFHSNNTSKNFTEHSKEISRLLNSFDLSPHHSKIRNNSIFFYKFRFTIISFLSHLKDRNTSAFYYLFIVLKMIFLTPLLSLKFITRYFSYKVFYLLYIRYLS